MPDRATQIAEAMLTDPTLRDFCGLALDAEIRRRWPGVTDGELLQAGGMAGRAAYEARVALTRAGTAERRP